MLLLVAYIFSYGMERQNVCILSHTRRRDDEVSTLGGVRRAMTRCRISCTLLKSHESINWKRTEIGVGRKRKRKRKNALFLIASLSFSSFASGTAASQSHRRRRWHLYRRWRCARLHFSAPSRRMSSAVRQAVRRTLCAPAYSSSVDLSSRRRLRTGAVHEDGKETHTHTHTHTRASVSRPRKLYIYIYEREEVEARNRRDSCMFREV